MSEEILSPGQDTWPDGVFLLPVCTTREHLHRTLTALFEAQTLLPAVDDVPESDATWERHDHIIDILEALGHIVNPSDAFCFVPSMPTEEVCRSYAPSAGFIDWFPNNPFLNPDFVGEGYIFPAWYLATTASNLAYGSSPGDVITSLDRTPPGSLPDVVPASGLPRFRINVNGAGTVKAKLVNLRLGSLIQTTVDDDVFSVSFVDVEREELSLPPESQTDFTVEFEFTTPGHHHVDFIVITWVTTSSPFLHHGGGLREVELCGFETMPVVTPPFRFLEDCGMEFYNGEEWLPVPGWSEFAPACFGAGDSSLTVVRTDPAGFGNMEQNFGAGYVDIANSDFVRRGGEFPMYGGLEIYPSTEQNSLTIRAASAPFSDLLKVLPTGRIEQVSYDTQPMAAVDNLTLDHEVAATPSGTNFGTAIHFKGKSSVTPSQSMARVRASWEDATHATRKSQLVLSVYDTEIRHFMRGGTNGAAPMIGVLGNPPSAKIPISGDAQGNQLLFDTVAAMATFGYLDVTGVTLGELPPEPPVEACDLTACQLAEVSARWFASEIFGVAAYWAGRYDETMFQSERFDKIIANVDLHFSNHAVLGDWVNEIYVAYGALDASDTDLNTFLAEASEYINTVVAGQLACFINDCGYVTVAEYAVFVDQLDDTAGVNHWVKDLLRTIDHLGLAAITSHARNSAYADNLTLDCESIDCGPPDPPAPPESFAWCARYPFTENPYWELYTPNAWGHGGEYEGGLGWRLTNGDAPGNDQNKIRIRKTFSSTAQIVEIHVRLRVANPGSTFPPFDTAIELYRGASFSQTQVVQHVAGYTDYIFSAANTNDPNILIYWLNDESEVYVTDIWVYGDSTEPTNSDGEIC